MSRRGFTLIELMVAVAIIAILAVCAGFTGASMRQLAAAELQREQALLRMEYEADLASRGRALDAAVLARLEAPLPDLVVARSRQGPATTLRLQWRDPLGRPASRSLTFLAGTEGP